jgi:hypothetical protein
MTLTGSKGEKRLTVPEFHRVTEGPVLGLEAVPWAEPRPVVKGYGVAADQIEVRSTIIHPSVIQADPLGEVAPAPWLMYYAPHHSPGIGVAGAERLIGPWRPLAHHPALRLEQFPGLTDHLSGPDVLWVPEENRLRMYCHGVVPGEGQQTGVAVSADGLHFEPLRGGPILPYPYLRVFRRARSWYGVCRFGDNLGLVRSEDGLAWDEWPVGLLLQTGEEHGEYDRLRHFCVRVSGNTLHLYYCTYRDPELRVEAIRLAVMSLEGDWHEWGPPERLGDVLRPELPWEAENLRDPYVVEAGGELTMFYVGGNEAGIGVATARCS